MPINFSFSKWIGEKWLTIKKSEMHLAFNIQEYFSNRTSYLIACHICIQIRHAFHHSLFELFINKK